MSNKKSIPPELNKPSRPQWRWWQIDLSQPKPSVSGRSRALLSRHVLNLRSDLVLPKQSPEASPPPRSAPLVRTRVDLRPGLGRPPSLAVSQEPWSALYQRWPVLAEISFLSAVEFVWWVVAQFWHFWVVIFLLLAEEVYVLLNDIKSDILEFFRLVRLTLVLPTRSLWALSPAVIKPVRQIPHLGQAGLFLVTALLFTLPLKGIATLREVEQRGQEATSLTRQAVHQLYEGGVKLTGGQPSLARRDFEQAGRVLQLAQDELYLFPDRVLGLLAKIPGRTEEFATARHLLTASRAVAQGAGVMAQAWQEISTASAGEGQGLRTQLQVIQSSFIKLQPHLEQALAAIAQVELLTLPADLQLAVAPLQNKLNQLYDLVASFTGLPAWLREVIASPEPQRYVILFQNSTELRPTGGFAGSLALLEMAGGKVTKLDIPGGGPYDFQGSLQRLIRPPEPMRLVRGTWQLQDATWFFDWPSSARKTLWFLREAGGPTADGVLAVTSDFVVDLLKLTGPIDVPSYGKHLTAENFTRVTQEAVELEYDRQANRPKQFIADLAPLLITRLGQLPAERQLELVQLIDRNLSRRSLQLYLTKPELEDNLRAYGWAGEIKTTPSDYLAVVRTNIGGGKTDGVIDEAIRHQVTLNESGELTAQLTLTRTHRGDPADIFERRRNVDYLRFYVPQGSVLLKATGFSPPPPSYFRPVPPGAEVDQDLTELEHEVAFDADSGTRITDEFGKTVFANWSALSPGQSQTMTIAYGLPLKLEQKIGWQDLRRYHIYFQRQAGVRPIDFSSTFKYPPGWRLRWQENSDQLQAIEQGIAFKSDWQQDEYYGLVLERLP
ncbi:MAG: DUF4012 domain-containing protein [Candidatus Kerfeldbacteria bacterium]|nr:DUF4012 domain-containing protein [Candidatus Kerfeldbacteria bacterium]